MFPLMKMMRPLQEHGDATPGNPNLLCCRQVGTNGTLFVVHVSKTSVSITELVQAF